MPEPDDPTVRRLLAAWRGEIEARTVYETLVQRERDPRRREILREIAAAEGRHRERLEGRLRELGATVPDPSTVRISPWVRLQARLAPINTVLAAREAAEDAEVDGPYKLTTGDAVTDRLLHDIRHDEQAHSRQVSVMRQGGDEAPGPAESRLQRILNRESWHQAGTGWVSGAIYGANDGLAAVFGIVSGVSGATGGSHFVLTAGLAGAVASALSMATGAFLAERSEAEVEAANVARERREIEEHPDEERDELSLFYQLKGLNKVEADELAAKLARNPEAMLKLLVGEELGMTGEGKHNPTQAAVAAGVSTAIGAIIPVIPFFWLTGTPGVLAAAAVSLIAHFLVGAAKALVTLRTWWASGLEMTLAGVIVGAITYVLGLLFHAS